MNAQLQTVAERLRTQDNQITANPIFVVQQRIRDYGYEPKWAEGTAWIDGQGEEITAPDDEATETGYRDRWEFVQPFFTEAAARAYIKANQHNLRECRVYVASGFRNAEWAMVRDLLLNPGENLEAKE